MAQWLEGKIVENVHWTENLFTLKIDADVDDFTAGQFTSLAVDVDGERVARPYSYLSSPKDRPLEFFFYTATDGILSNALVKLGTGDKVWIKQQSNGFFVLREIPECDEMWMLGTGTGIAPFFSILNTEEPWQRFKKVVLVHAVRTLADLRYQEMIEALKAKYNDRFIFQAFVSREIVEGTINGRIPGAIEDGTLEEKAGLKLDLEKSHIMLCGNPAMVKDSVDMLKIRGFAKNRRGKPGHITIENYW
ncbi:MAG: ferredoxin--NADP(+) reductase [Gammaproteobacteria bacterium]|nr:ferredoxin--NADP(+) reductase [Gammaproteobacteria bacterium]